MNPISKPKPVEGGDQDVQTQEQAGQISDQGR